MVGQYLPTTGRRTLTEHGNDTAVLVDGVAHIAFKGHAVFYDAGRRHPLTAEEWQKQYCIGEAGRGAAGRH
jgi:hypothetical protein